MAPNPGTRPHRIPDMLDLRARSSRHRRPRHPAIQGWRPARPCQPPASPWRERLSGLQAEVQQLQGRQPHRTGTQSIQGVVMLYVITGPPAAGKSTWVREHAKPGDVVIDYDLLASALTGPTGSPAPVSQPRPSKVLRDVTYRARRAAVDESLKHVNSVDVYIIHTHLTDQTRSLYSAHDAHFIVVDPGKAVVLERIRLMRSPSQLAVAQRWYASSSLSSLPASHSLCMNPQQSRSW